MASTSEKQYCGSQEDAPKQKAKSLEPSTMLIHRLNLYMLFSHATPFGEKQVSPRNRVAIKGAVKINSSFQFFLEFTQDNPSNDHCKLQVRYFK